LLDDMWADELGTADDENLHGKPHQRDGRCDWPPPCFSPTLEVAHGILAGDHRAAADPHGTGVAVQRGMGILPERWVSRPADHSGHPVLHTAEADRVDRRQPSRLSGGAPLSLSSFDTPNQAALPPAKVSAIRFSTRFAYRRRMAKYGKAAGRRVKSAM